MLYFRAFGFLLTSLTSCSLFASSQSLDQYIPAKKIINALDSSDSLVSINHLYAKSLPVFMFPGAKVDRIDFSKTEIQVDVSLSYKARMEYSDPTDSLSRFAVDHIYPHICNVVHLGTYNQLKPSVNVDIYSQGKLIYGSIEFYEDICI